MASKLERELAGQVTPFVHECRRLINARLAATTSAEKDDAEWALQYVLQMNKAGRLDEYFANQQAMKEAV